MGLEAETSNTGVAEQPDGSAPGEPTALDQLLKRTGARQTPSATPLRRLVGNSIPTPIAAFLLAVAIAVGWAGWHLLARPAPIEERMPVAGEASAASRQVDGESGGGTPGSTTRNPSPEGDARDGDEGAEGLVVHVAGAVARAGVVELAVGSRVGDALAAAGGPVAGADLVRLNLAAPLVDGARLYVPVVGEEVPPELDLEVPAATGSAAGAGEVVVDINSADGVELETLPGVGPATAAAIIDHRDRVGRFESAEGLLAVRGIGEAKLAAMADLVSVG